MKKSERGDLRRMVEAVRSADFGEVPADLVDAILAVEQDLIANRGEAQNKVKALIERHASKASD